MLFFGFNSHEFPLFTITVQGKETQGTSLFKLVLDFVIHKSFRAFDHSGALYLINFDQGCFSLKVNLISNINDHLGLKPTVTIVTIATGQ